MLTKCPECDLQISDKALSCPHCGYPLVEKAKKPHKVKRRRLPNGFGRITKIKGKNLRKPYRALVTVSKDSAGRPIAKPLKPSAYFETYNEAYTALLEYNRNPYDLDVSITVEELYKRWSEQYFKQLKSDSSTRTIESAWAYCHTLYSMRAKDIRARHIKGVMEDGTVVITTGRRKGEIKHTTPNIQCRIKSLWNLMMDYALEYELVDRNYARTFDISTEVIDEKESAKRGHLSYTEEEMDKLIKHNSNLSKIVVFQCYSGWRPQELGLLRKENIYLEEGYMIGGMKTKAGTDRTVPIHPAIKSIVEEFYNQSNSEYLITLDGGSFTYDKYKHRFDKLIEELGINPDHRPHDGRKQFVTMCKDSGVDEYAIKMMVGHAINDVTESVYTDRNIDWFRKEIEKVKSF